MNLKTNNNDLEYYMSLPYKITVEDLNEDEGGGVFLCIPQLGAAAVNAHADTYQNARAILEEVKKDYIKIWLEAGVEIPKPRKDLLIFEQFEILEARVAV